MSYTPSLEEAISQAIEDHLLDVHTSIPAIIESYNSFEQTASVRIAIKKKNIIGDREEVLDRPIIPDVPVLFPKGGNFHLTYPLKKGDDVQLIFSERSTERWKSESGVVDPKDARKFHLSDAFILPTSGRKPSSGASDSKTRIVSGNSIAEFGDDGTLFLKNQKATVTLNPSGEIELKNGSGKVRVTASGKFKVEGAKELLTIIETFIQTMEGAQTLTALGLQPLFPPTPALLAQLKTDLQSIKE